MSLGLSSTTEDDIHQAINKERERGKTDITSRQTPVWTIYQLAQRAITPIRECEDPFRPGVYIYLNSMLISAG